MQNQRLEAIDASGRGLRVEFAWQEDRFGHSIWRMAGDEAGAVVLLLRSIEGSAREMWPPSPPLQSLSLQTLPDGRRVALLVGMAGRSHWSASVEALPDQPAIVFDIACRTSEANCRLGSAYGWTADAAQQVRLEVDEDIGGGIEQSAERVAMLPREERPASTKTIRWKYRVVLRAEGEA